MTRPHSLMPMLAASLGIALFSVMDATMKRASLASDVYTAMLLRSLIAAALLCPLWRLRGGRWPTPAVLRLHATRAVVVAAMALLFFYGLERLPLAEAIAISFIAPLIALYLAAVMLGERIGRRALAGSLLGLAGVAVIAVGQLRPGATAIGRGQAWGIAAVLGSAVLYAWNLILQRQQARLANPLDVAMFQNLLVALILVAPAPWLAGQPSLPRLGLAAAAAVLGASSLMLLTWAYARAEAQMLLPLEYTAFIWAALMGRLWFAESLDPATLLAAPLIVAGCWIGSPGSPAQHIEQTAV